MHCLFLGIAKWIVKWLWVDHRKLSINQLRQIQNKMSEIQVPSNISRIPRKVDCGEGFANFTANEWKTFILIYATHCLWDYLLAPDRKILTNFVQICTIPVCQIIDITVLEEAHN